MLDFACSGQGSIPSCKPSPFWHHEQIYQTGPWAVWVLYLYISPVNCAQEFLWQPVMNDSMIEVFKDYNSQPVNKRPSLIVLGSATVSTHTAMFFFFSS